MFFKADKQDWGLEASLLQIAESIPAVLSLGLLLAAFLRVIFSVCSADIAASVGAVGFNAIVLCKQHKQ